MSQITEQDEEITPAQSREEEWLAKYKPLPYPRLAERMVELRDASSKADREKKDLDAELDVIRLKVVPERFAADEISSMRIAGVGTLSLTSDMYCTQKKDRQEELFQWLRDNEYGDIIKDTVNASTLKALVKELLEEKKGELAKVEASLDSMLDEGPTSAADEIASYLNITPFMRASVTKR